MSQTDPDRTRFRRKFLSLLWQAAWGDDEGKCVCIHHDTTTGQRCLVLLPQEDFDMILATSWEAEDLEVDDDEFFPECRRSIETLLCSEHKSEAVRIMDDYRNEALRM